MEDEGSGRIVWGGSDPEFFKPPMHYVDIVRKGHFEVGESTTICLSKYKITMLHLKFYSFKSCRVIER